MRIAMSGRLRRVLGLIGLGVLVFGFPAAGAEASEVRIGVQAGRRALNDARLDEIYGSDWIFVPSLAWEATDLLGFELAFETGYGKSGAVGIYREESRLVLHGWEGTFRLRHRFSRVIPFVKLGLGYQAYRQEISSEFVRLKVDHHAVGPVFGLGADLILGAGFRLSGEVKALPLKVQPFDVEVDLGGVRLLLGLSYGFDL